MEYLKHHYKALIVKFKFLHNDVEWRLVLYGGDKYETLLWMLMILTKFILVTIKRKQRRLREKTCFTRRI